MWILSQITAFRGSHMFAVYAHNAYVHVDHYISAMCHDNYARMIKWSGDQGKQEFSSTPSEPLSLPLKKGRLRQMITDDQLMKIRKMFAQKPRRTGLQASLCSEVFENLALSWASDRSSRIIIALRGNILWYDDEKNGVNLVAKINRCVKMEIPRPSNTVGPPSPSPPPR